MCRNSIERKQDKVFEYLTFLVKGKHTGERRLSSPSWVTGQQVQACGHRGTGLYTRLHCRDSCSLLSLEQKGNHLMLSLLSSTAALSPGCKESGHSALKVQQAAEGKSPQSLVLGFNFSFIQNFSLGFHLGWADLVWNSVLWCTAMAFWVSILNTSLRDAKTS